MPENPLIRVLENSPCPLFERITDYVSYYAEQQPDAECAADSTECLSWRQLAEQVEELSGALIAAGAERGDRIALLAPPGCRFLVLFLACASIGITWIGLNPRYTAAEMRYIIGDAKPKLLFAFPKIDTRDYHAELDEISTNLMAGTPWIDVSAGFEDFILHRKSDHATRAMRMAETTPDDVVLLVYTSGSTGRPKGAQLHHRGIARAAWVHASVWQAPPMRALNNLPINHVGCVCDLACSVVAAGGFTAFMERFDAEGSLRAIERHKLTFWGQIPTQFQMSLNSLCGNRYDLSSLRLIIWSGARAPTDLVAELHAICPNLSNSYGMTETIGSLTISPIISDPAAFENTVGWPDPGRNIRIDPDGEVQAKDPFVMRGYLGRPNDDPSSWTSDGWFRTGDIARINSDGSYNIIGRCKEMFKSGGYNVYPREIEEAIESYPGISAVAVVPMPDALYDEVGCAFIVTSPAHVPDVEALKAHLRQRLANYKIPKQIIPLEALPQLSVGKIDRKALGEKARAL